jgi:hypothetical protein
MSADRCDGCKINKTKTIQNPSTVRTLMWTFTPSLSDKLFTISNVVLIVGAAAVFIGTIGSILMTGVREQFSNEHIEDARRGAAEANARGLEAELKLAELDKSMHPRLIDDESAKEFVNSLKPFAGTPFDVRIDPAAEYRFVNSVITLLNEAGWKWHSYSASLITFPTGDAKIPGTDHPAIGSIQVRINGSRYDDFKKPASELAIALTQAIKASSSLAIDPANSPLAYPPDAITIEIRRKL